MLCSASLFSYDKGSGDGCFTRFNLPFLIFTRAVCLFIIPLFITHSHSLILSSRPRVVLAILRQVASTTAASALQGLSTASGSTCSPSHHAGECRMNWSKVSRGCFLMVTIGLTAFPPSALYSWGAECIRGRSLQASASMGCLTRCSTRTIREWRSSGMSMCLKWFP